MLFTRYRLLFTWLLPVACLAGCAAAVLAPAFSDTLTLHRLARGARVIHLTLGPVEMTLESERFFSFSLDRASLRAGPAITILNAPARFIDLLLFRNPNFAPARMMPWVWQAFAYPLYAAPLWAVVGRSIDRLRSRERSSRSGLWVSIVFAALLGALSLALRFGMTEADRQNDEKLRTAILGFGLWAILLALPLLEPLRRPRA